MQSLNYCANCGRQVPPGGAYCPGCGARVASIAPEARTYGYERRRRRARQENDWWGLVTAGGFLVIIALTLFTYPDVFTRLIDYFRSFGVYGRPVLPSNSLGQVIIYFFNIAGAWGLLAAGLRLVVTRSVVKSAQDAVGAIFALYIAYAFSLFYAKAFGGWSLLGSLIVGLAGVIIVNALIEISYFGARTSKASAVASKDED